MLKTGDVVVLQQAYGEFPAGTEMSVGRVKLKAETLEVERAGKRVMVKRADLIRSDTHTNRLGYEQALRAQSMSDFRNKTVIQDQPLEGIRVRFVRPTGYDRRGNPIHD